MRALWHALVIAGERILIEPIRKGGPRVAEWPQWLRPIVLFAGFAYAVGCLLVFGSDWIRANDRLVTDGSLVIGAWSLTVLFWLIVIALALLVTAALHIHPLIRVLSLLLTAPVLLLIAAAPSPLPILVELLCVLCLVIISALRAGRRPAWFEFPVVLLVLVFGVFGAMALSDRDVLGFDTRITSLLALMMVVMLIAMPTLVMAGYALIEVPVTVAEAIGERVRRRFGERPGLGMWVLLALAVGVVGWDTWSGVVGGHWDWRAEAWLASIVAILLAAVLSVLLLWGRRPHHRPQVSEAYGSFGYPLAIALVSFVVIGSVGIFLGTLVGALGLPAGLQLGQWAAGWLASEQAIAATRCLAAVVLLIVAARRVRRGDRVSVITAAAFAILVGCGSLVLWTGGRWALTWTVETLSAWCALLALVRLVVAAIRGQARAAFWPALTVVLIAALIGRRTVLAEPASVAAGASGMAVLMLGLLWRLLTDAEITRGDSRHFPQVTRVLLYAANSLLAVTTLAVLSVSRSELPQLDVDRFAEMGMNLIGAPLLLATLMVTLWRPLDRLTVSGRAAVPAAEGIAPPGATPDRVQTPLSPTGNLSRDREHL